MPHGQVKVLNPGPAVSHCYEMALTRAEFLRLLPAAVDNASFSIDGNEISGDTGGLRWRIGVEEHSVRRLALLAVPELGVRLTVENGSPEEAERFTRRFLLGFQRAGG